ncbi:hypothetical protein MU852_04100 [Brevundimonas albigilva]|uniref:hypothetical protein n=1 Tax=Brevundimonas albigilva TaxID=1312364 RepID=UPI00201B5B08|nr:hypothetical protein [Brevundimonas albigilva]UQV19053.1 hypothetical protein MU852_04100 [Brevundimonas albigilva]
MSSSKKKETTKATTTTTPTNPAWVTGGVQNLANQITGLSGQDPSTYFAPANDLQNAAFSGGMNLGNQPTLSWLSGLGSLGFGGGQQPQGPQVMPASAGPTGGKVTGPDLNPQVMPTSAGPGGVAGKPTTAPNGGPQVMPTSAGPGNQPQGTSTSPTSPGAPTGAAPGTAASGGMGLYDLAGLLGFGAATAGPNLATTQGYQAAGPAPTTGYTASGPAQVQGYNPALATAANAGQAQGYQATSATSQGYSPTTYNAQTGTAQTYNPTTGQAVLGQAASAGQASTYNPTMLDLSGSASARRRSAASAGRRRATSPT